MALVIPSGYAQASIELRNAGDPEPWYVTHGISLEAVGADHEQAGQTVIRAFMSGWGSFLRTTTRCTGTYLTIGNGPENFTIFVAPTTAQVGTSTAEKLPQNCAYLVQKITGRPGRSGKGRCFLPGVAPEGSVDDTGVINAGGITSAQAACNTWKNGLDTGAADEITPMVVLHNEGIVGSTVPSLVTRLQISPVIATQRRRLRR